MTRRKRESEVEEKEKEDDNGVKEKILWK